MIPRFSKFDLQAEPLPRESERESRGVDLRPHDGGSWGSWKRELSGGVGFSLIRGILILLFLNTLFATYCDADEYSLFRNSTLVGRSFGLPVGEWFESGESSQLSLITETLFFAKNLELTGSNNVDGQTFIGFVAPIRLAYRTENVQLEVGGFIGRNYGDDDTLDISEPLFRIIYQPVPNAYAIAGSLIQSHWIHDGLRDDVRLFLDGQETGLQVRIDRENFKSDTWLDWRVRETAVRAEVFDIASANQIRLGRLWIDGQFFWSHSGGQLNTSNTVINNATGMVGLSIGVGPQNQFGDLFRTGISFLVSRFESRNATNFSGNGLEFWIRSDVELAPNHWVRWFAKHFEGDDFFARQGDPLYQFDQYTQLGVDWVANLSTQLDFEFGIVGQRADDEWMNTYRINFAWRNQAQLSQTSVVGGDLQSPVIPLEAVPDEKTIPPPPGVGPGPLTIHPLLDHVGKSYFDSNRGVLR